MEEVNAIGTKGLFTLGGLVAVALITSFSLRAYRDYLEIKELKKQLKQNYGKEDERIFFKDAKSKKKRC